MYCDVGSIPTSSTKHEILCHLVGDFSLVNLTNYFFSNLTGNLKSQLVTYSLKPIKNGTKTKNSFLAIQVKNE